MKFPNDCKCEFHQMRVAMEGVGFTETKKPKKKKAKTWTCKACGEPMTREGNVVSCTACDNFIILTN